MWVALLLTISPFVVVLQGCGGEGGSASTPTAATTPSSQAISTTYDISMASGGIFSETSGAIEGFFPDGDGPFPLFMWMPGTGELPNSAISQYQTQQMANRGYAAVAVQYPEYFNITAAFESKARTVVGPNVYTPLSLLCANTKIDCSLGVAAGGYSQGTHIAVLLAKFNSSIKAAYMVEGARPTIQGTWTMCDDATIGHNISKSKRRYITGECDQYYAWPTDGSAGYTPSRAAAEDNLKLASGYDCSSEPNCIQSDGSGYRVSITADTDGAGCPDHFNWAGKSKTSTELASWFVPLNTASLDWLASAARTTVHPAHV